MGDLEEDADASVLDSTANVLPDGELSFSSGGLMIVTVLPFIFAVVAPGSVMSPVAGSM